MLKTRTALSVLSLVRIEIESLYPPPLSSPLESKPRQEVTEMGHLYYLLDPRDEPPPSQLPPPTSSVPPPLPSLKSRSHSSSPLPNNHSPAHQSANPAHSGENSPSHPRAHSMSSKTDQAGVNKSSDLVVTSQEAR